MRKGLTVMLALGVLGCGGASDTDKAKDAYQKIATCQPGHEPAVSGAVTQLRHLVAAHPHDSKIGGYAQRAVDELRRCTGTG